MVHRRPLVRIEGQTVQLPEGDTLPPNGSIPFYDASGAQKLIALSSTGKVPFVIADGTTHNDIPLV